MLLQQPKFRVFSFEAGVLVPPRRPRWTIKHTPPLTLYSFDCSLQYEASHRSVGN